jgi:osmotically-inducible protein OsmY
MNDQSQNIRSDNKLPPAPMIEADRMIFDEICELFSQNPLINLNEMQICVTDGVVDLKGVVMNGETKEWAEFSVKNVEGVEEVSNKLHICHSGKPVIEV